MPHYALCVNCLNAQDSVYHDMFLCDARGIQIPDSEVIRACQYYTRRLDKEML